MADAMKAILWTAMLAVAAFALAIGSLLITGCASSQTTRGYDYYRDAPASQLIADLHAKEQVEAQAFTNMDPAVRAEIMREHYDFTHQRTAPTYRIQRYGEIEETPSLGDPILVPVN
jgi:hypothetical protein